MITNSHKIIKIWQIIWSLLPFAVVFLKLAYLFCVQIVRQQLCFNIFSTFGKVLWFKSLLYRKILLFRIHLCQKVDFEKMVITSFCRGRAVFYSGIFFSSVSSLKVFDPSIHSERRRIYLGKSIPPLQNDTIIIS